MGQDIVYKRCTWAKNRSFRSAWGKRNQQTVSWFMQWRSLLENLCLWHSNEQVIDEYFSAVRFVWHLRIPSICTLTFGSENLKINTFRSVKTGIACHLTARIIHYWKNIEKCLLASRLSVDCKIIISFHHRVVLGSFRIWCQYWVRTARCNDFNLILGVLQFFSIILHCDKSETRVFNIKV